MRLFLLYLALCLSILAPGGAWARPVTESEKALLESALVAFEGNMTKRAMGEVISAMPPRIIPQMAKQSGMDVDALKALVIKLSSNAMNMIEDFAFDHQSIAFKELADGSPYALIPTTSTINLKDGPSYRAKSQTLAILEDGRWYLMRVEEPKQLIILHASYPGFVGVELPQGSMELLEE